MRIKKTILSMRISAEAWTGLSVIVALLSLIVSVRSCYSADSAVAVAENALAEQKRQFSEVQTEKLDIQLVAQAYDPLQVTRINFREQGQVIVTPWKLLLSNTGQQKLSITGYELSEGKSVGARFYTGLNGGMYDELRQRINPSDTPIHLEPGDTRIFTLHIGLLVKSKVADVLWSNADTKTGFVAGPTLSLAKAGLDLYGNEVEFKEYATGMTYTRLTSVQTPTFWYRATTGRGNAFLGSGVTSATAEFFSRGP